MTVQHTKEHDRIEQHESNVRMMQTVIMVARLVRPYTCEERREIEARVKTIFA